MFGSNSTGVAARSARPEDCTTGERTPATTWAFVTT